MFQRITVNPKQMGGVPCIRGLRIPVATVVGMVAEGMTTDEILTAYPDLQSDDVSEALRFAAEAVRVIMPLVSDTAPVELEQRGIDQQQAGDLRRRLAAFAEDWDKPEMDVYDAPCEPPEGIWPR